MARIAEPPGVAANLGTSAKPATDARVAVVVLNWNGLADTLRCLESVRALKGEQTFVVVVDNGSTDASVPTIRSRFSDVTLIENASNLGYAEGNNVGIRYALEHHADFILVLNNDTVCRPDLIDKLLAAAGRDPMAGMLSPRICYMSEPERIWFDGAVWNSAALRFDFPRQGERARSLPDGDHESAFACGAALLVRAEVVRQIGTFDPRFFLVWEESDWCYRARRAAGWRSVVVGDAIVWHQVGASFGTEASPMRTYFSYRNRLVWLSRHGTYGERLRALRKAARALVPHWAPVADPRVNLSRRCVWALRDWWTALCGRGNAVQYLATRRAVLDYLASRLGPTPGEVTRLNQQWAKRLEG